MFDIRRRVAYKLRGQADSRRGETGEKDVGRRGGGFACDLISPLSHSEVEQHVEQLNVASPPSAANIQLFCSYALEVHV